MNKIALWILTFLCVACNQTNLSNEFTKEIVQTENFDLLSMQKISEPNGVYKFYIEGDDFVFDEQGRPIVAEIKQNLLMQKLAITDKSPNVIYLARPCQFVWRKNCALRHCTSAQFAPEVISAEYEAIKKIAGTNPIILISYSKGAQIAGLLATTKQDLNVRKIVTIAGNLNHLVWSEYHNLPPLNESMNLENYKDVFYNFEQVHYVGSKDDEIPPHLVLNFVKNKDDVVIINGASHNQGWKNIFSLIHNEK